ncbi:MAG: hypothetical protein AAGD92_10985 [Pseudomonadota bacterium]
MIDFDYAAQHLRGVSRLLIGRDDWREDMDFSTDGVFKSLWAIALTAPFSALGFIATEKAVRHSPDYTNTMFAKAPFSLLLVAELIGLVLFWGVSIALLAFTAKRIGASRHAAGAIVSFNWSQLLSSLVWAVPAAILVVTNQPEVLALAVLPVIILGLFLLWRVLRQGLAMTIGGAVSFIVMLMIFEVAFNSLLMNGAIWLYRLMS